MLAVMRRELKSYFTGVIAYVYAAVLLLIGGYFVRRVCLVSLSSRFENALGYASLALVVLIPILSMRVLAEERRSRTDQLLYSLPITVADIVLGKYFAMVAVILFSTAVLALYPLQLSMFGHISFPVAYSTLFAFFLLASSLASIGVFISSLTENQVFAAVICLLVLAVLYFAEDLTGLVPSDAYASLIALCAMGVVLGAVMYVFTRSAPFSMAVAALAVAAVMALYFVNGRLFVGLFPSLIAMVAPFERFYRFASGIFDLTAVLYFVSLSAVFLFFTVQTLERRRWS